MPTQTSITTRTARVNTADDRRGLHAQLAVEETVDTATAAELLYYRPQTLRRWACQGTGPLRARRINGRLRWSVAEIRVLMAGESASMAIT